MDLLAVRDQVPPGAAMLFYDAQVSMSTVTSAVTGGALLLTSAVMLAFYVKYYVDAHRSELGILKAIGYSDIRIASQFWVFGLSVLAGTLLGFAGAFAVMPLWYGGQNQQELLPEVTPHFSLTLFVALVALPTIIFSILAIFFAYRTLRAPVLSLLKDIPNQSELPKSTPGASQKRRFFVEELKRSTLRTRKVLVFFVVFASFCFAAMTQMSATMKDVSSNWVGIMIFLIGIILGCATLFLAITTVINENTKTIAMMKIFGYSQGECSQALLVGYRPAAYVGFALGTIFQYALLRVMITIVFKDAGEPMTYSFDWQSMLASLIGFAIVYELVMSAYSRRIGRVPLKEAILET